MKKEKTYKMMDTIFRDWYEYYKARGIGPSYKELMTLTGIGSTSTIHKYIRMLADAGYIQYQPGKSRTVMITDVGRSYLEGQVASD